MTHPKFGNKFTCWNCAAKFYDMKKADARCPKCSSDPKDDPALKSSEKGKRGNKEEAAEGEDFEEEKFDNDMDELANDDEADGDEEAEVDEIGGAEEEP
jgi:hypothetical protein